ncbi:hypothetical protein SteCoe_34455 [Stentor coeruleus]|uniref:Uncharacterized protein n=1 Tax=Stentor coeruleus TaxID=5963 RepID=A0A1R2AUI4_9CILI|nr:hypothetical protein SteCoe_34455 [Stentor coeruleus]
MILVFYSGNGLSKGLLSVFTTSAKVAGMSLDDLGKDIKYLPWELTWKLVGTVLVYFFRLKIRHFFRVIKCEIQLFKTEEQSSRNHRYEK